MRCVDVENKKVRIAAGLALPVYAIGVLYFTMLWRTGGFTGSYEMHLNLVPLFWIWEPLVIGKDFYLQQVILNIFLFVPLGLMLPIIWRSCKMKNVLTVASVVTLGIELIQPFFGRCTDIDDVLLNIAGAMIGYTFMKRINNRYCHKCHAGKWAHLAMLTPSAQQEKFAA